MSNGSHIRHGATGGHIGQDYFDCRSVAFGDLLRAICQNVGSLGHKVHAAEDNRPTLGARRGLLAQLVAITPQIGMVDDFILLVVMAQNEQAFAQFLTPSIDPPRQFVVAERLVIGQGKLAWGAG